jgi:hypothetical protein
LYIVAARVRHRLAVVERLELGELVGVLLEQVAEPPDEARAIARQDARPRTALEGPAGGGDRRVDIGFVPGWYMADDLFGCGILDRKGLAALRVDPFAVDQELVGLGEKGSRGGAKRRCGWRSSWGTSRNYS